LTIKFLGNNVRWLFGSATLGFAAVSADLGWPDQATGSKYTQVLPSRLTLRVPSGEHGPSVSNVSYFIGVWNAPDLVDGAGAYQSVSMDYYSKMMWTATSMEKLAELNSEVSLLRIQRDQFAREIAASNIERASLSATLALEIREREILGVQAAALRRENDILSSQLLALRNEREIMAAEVVTLGAERNALQTSLDWHIARVVSLDESLSGQVARSVSLEEALSWHVSRVQNLESEGPRRLARRALSRTIQAWPPLARLVSRLRRHNASQAENT
jgi:chromosome segregation ATPase